MNNVNFKETIDELLTAWDNGDSVWSVEMGGMGGPYEMAIQNLMIELCREFKKIEDWDLIDEKEIQSIRQKVYDSKFKGEGYSGAQVGAATNLAAIFCRAEGPLKAYSTLNDSRIIIINKNSNEYTKLVLVKKKEKIK